MNKSCSNVVFPEYASAGVGVAILSFIPVLLKWCELKTFRHRSSGGPGSPASNDRVTKCADSRTHDTRSTCSASLYSDSKRRHRRQASVNTASSHHDEEFLNSIRNKRSVLDCQSHSSCEEADKKDVTSSGQLKGSEAEGKTWLDEEVVVTESEKRDDATRWMDEAIAGSAPNSACSSFEESRHGLSPTGYISMVVFSSHSMGADSNSMGDGEDSDNEAAYWNRNIDGQDDKSCPSEDDEDETLLNSEHSERANASTKDALSAMLHDTVNKMELMVSSSRNVMAGRAETLMKTGSPSRVSNEKGSFQNDDFMVSSPCGTLNLSLGKSSPPANSRKPCKQVQRDAHSDFTPTPYPLTRSVPRLSAIQLHGGKIFKGKDAHQTKPESESADCSGDLRTSPEVSDHERSVASVPDDEKQQDAQVEKEEDNIIHSTHEKHSTKRDDDVRFRAADKDRLSISQSLSMSLKHGFDLKKGVQCHGGGIQSVASSE
ncbi:MAG: hypothetical protein SGILL_009373 [Bacillariaceae sp.]